MPARAEHEEGPLAAGLPSEEPAERNQFVVAEQQRIDRTRLIVADERHRYLQVGREASLRRDGRGLQRRADPQRRRVLGPALGELPHAEFAQ